MRKFYLPIALAFLLGACTVRGSGSAPFGPDFFISEIQEALLDCREEVETDVRVFSYESQTAIHEGEYVEGDPIEFKDVDRVCHLPLP